MVDTKEPVTVDLEYIDETELAILFRTSSEDDVWLPKSQIMNLMGEKVTGAIWDVDIPEWLAEQEGLI